MLLLNRNWEKDKGVLTQNDETIPDGFLIVTGKEVSGETFTLEFDHEALRWSFASEKKPEQKSNVNWLLITGLLKGKKLTPKEISGMAKLNYSTVKTILGRMKDKDIAQPCGGGKWALFGHCDDDTGQCETVDRW